jgi:TRAP-type C4-dicarboxylate transport system permease small subunit
MTEPRPARRTRGLLHFRSLSTYDSSVDALRRLQQDLRTRFPDEPPIARTLRLGDSVLGLAEQVVLFCLLAFTVFVTVTSFVADHVSDKPMEGAHNDIRYACFLLAMIGGAYAAHHRRLLSMDFVSHFLPARFKAWTRVVNTTFAAIIAGVFTKFGYYIFDSQIEEQHTRGAHEHWMPESWAASAMLIGASLLTLHLVIQIVIDLDYLLRGKLPPEPTMGAA